jgi:hypothetical protein
VTENEDVKPPTAQLVDEMVAASGLTEAEVLSAGVDMLHFVWSAIRSGSSLMLEQSDGTYGHVEILVPGLIEEWS